MTGGQIAALIFAIILLLPGGCFLVVGIGTTIDGGDSIERGLGPLALAIGTGLGVLIVFLFRVAFRRRAPTAVGQTPSDPDP